MTEPVFSHSLERLYQGLPNHYLQADEKFGYPLKIWMSGITTEFQVVEDLITRFSHDSLSEGGQPGETSDLVDPYAADEAWLPWLGQLLGVSYSATDTGVRRRIATVGRSEGPGTQVAIAEAAKSALVGDKYVAVYEHTSDVAHIREASSWDILIVTRESESLKNSLPAWVSSITTPSLWDVATDIDVMTSYYVNEDWPIYQNRAMVIEAGGNYTDPFDIAVTSTYSVHVVPTEPCHAMLNIFMTEGTEKIGTFGIKWFNSSGTEVSTQSTNITVTPEVNQFHFTSVVPAGAATMKSFFTVNDMTVEDHVGIAQHGVRLETDEPWILETTNPIKAIIDKGEKPAGFRLHHQTFSATWDAFTANNPTMVDLEGRTWTELEENLES